MRAGRCPRLRPGSSPTTGRHLVESGPPRWPGPGIQRARRGLAGSGSTVPMGRLDGESRCWPWPAWPAAMAAASSGLHRGPENALLPDVSAGSPPGAGASRSCSVFARPRRPARPSRGAAPGSGLCQLCPVPTKGTAQAAGEEAERRVDLPESVRSHWTAAPTPVASPTWVQVSPEWAPRPARRRDGEAVRSSPWRCQWAAEPRFGRSLPPTKGCP